MLSTMKKTIQLLSQVSISLAVLTLIINVSVVMYGVITRYVVGGAPIWTDELARYTMIATAFFAVGGVWQLGGHMRVSLAERFLPQPMQHVVILYQWLLSLLFAAAGIWLTTRYALSVSMFQSHGLGISRTIPMFCMPIGFTALTLIILLRGPRPLPQQNGESS